MFCKKCGNQMAEHATVCESCNTRTKPGVFCHKCATELPANTTRCISCNAKSRAHKKAIHWLPLPLALLSFICYAAGGYYDSAGLPYTTSLDYVALAVAIIGLIIAAVVVPSTRMALKIIGLLLNGIMLFLTVSWILDVLLV